MHRSPLPAERAATSTSVATCFGPSDAGYELRMDTVCVIGMTEYAEAALKLGEPELCEVLSDRLAPCCAILGRRRADGRASREPCPRRARTRARASIVPTDPQNRDMKMSHTDLIVIGDPEGASVPPFLIYGQREKLRPEGPLLLLAIPSPTLT